MKKFLAFFSAVLALVAFASCTREVNVQSPEEGTVEVTFNIDVPQSVATKAVSDGTGATKLIFQVFDVNNKALPKLAQEVPVDASYKATIQTRLIKGVTYNFIFWAQTPDKYITLAQAQADGGKPSFTIPDETLKTMMNDDSFDAFYARLDDYYVAGPFATAVTLTRPFAQINVGSVDGDFDAAKDSNFAVDETLKTAYVLEVPNAFDLLNGVASGATSVDFTKNSHITSQKLTVENTDYDYVAMAYVLMDAPNAFNATAPVAEAKLTKDLVLNLATTQNGDDISLTRNVYNVPMQRNFRTNILGHVFSVEGQFTITVDANFQKDLNGNEHLPEYADIAALNAAFAKNPAADADKWSYKVKLLSAGDTKIIYLPKTLDPVDIVFADGAFATEDIEIKYADGAADDEKPLKLNLAVDQLNSLVANLPQTTITVKDGSNITTSTITSASTTFVLEKQATVENLIILGGGSKLEGTVGTADITMADGEEAEVKGTVTTKLTVKSGSVSVEAGADVTELNVEGTATAEVKADAGVGTVNVTGTATAVVDSNAKVETITSEQPTAVTDENGAVPENVQLPMNSAEALRKALATEEEVIDITLVGDILDADGIFLAAAHPKTLTIDLNGHTLGLTKAVGSTSTETQGLHLEKNSTVVIKNGTLTASKNDGVRMVIQNYANLTLENVLVDGTKLASGEYVTSNNCGTVNLIGTTAIKVPENGFAFDACVTNHYPAGTQITVNTTGKIEGKIEYGVWDSIPADNKVTLNIVAADLSDAVLVVDSRLAETAAEHISVANSDAVILPADAEKSAAFMAFWPKAETEISFAAVAPATELPEAIESDGSFQVKVASNSPAAIAYEINPVGGVSIEAGEGGIYTISGKEYEADQEITITFSQAAAPGFKAASKDLTFKVNAYVAPVAADESPYTFDLTTGWENAQEVTDVLSPGKNVKLVFAQGTNDNNAPKYYTNGTAVRTYEGNTLNVSAGGKYITKIEFVYGDTNVLSSENFGEQGKYVAAEKTWYGTNETNVAVAISGKVRFQSVKVTFGDEVGVLPDDPSSISINDTEVEVESVITITPASINPATADFVLSTTSDLISISGKEITGIAEGTAEVTATIEAAPGQYKGSSTTFNVTVKAKAVTPDPGPGTDPEPIDYSEVETSNVTLTKVTNATDASVNGNTALKMGTSSKGGSMSVKVPAGTTKLYIHACAWKGDAVVLTINGATTSVSELSLSGSDGATSNSPFTITDVADHFFAIELSDVTEEKTITFTSKTAKRFVVWGVNAE